MNKIISIIRWGKNKFDAGFRKTFNGSIAQNTLLHTLKADLFDLKLQMHAITHNLAEKSRQNIYF